MNPLGTSQRKMTREIEMCKDKYNNEEKETVADEEKGKEKE